MICRIGGITKQQIGSIKTFPEETRFEIANTHVEAFRKLAAMNTNEANITPSEAPHSGMFKGGARNRRDEGGERPYAKKPFRRDESGGRAPAVQEAVAAARRARGGAERPAFNKKPLCSARRGQALSVPKAASPRAPAPSRSSPSRTSRPAASRASSRPASPAAPSRSTRPASLASVSTNQLIADLPPGFDPGAGCGHDATRDPQTGRDPGPGAGGRYASFEAFYYYIHEHSNRTCRRIHVVGTGLVIAAFGAFCVTLNPWWLLAMPLVGYGFAWVGHFFFEKNRPATFKYPLGRGLRGRLPVVLRDGQRQAEVLIGPDPCRHPRA